jgi:hypothetical protein
MLRKFIILLIFLVFATQTLYAGFFCGFGVGYTAKNVYEDSAGEMEEESNVPLLGLSAGYSASASVVEFVLDADIDFFAMDLIRGNREYILFANPSAFITVPLRIGKLGISPVVGYGGMHRARYIKERTYLSAESRYINPANFSDNVLDILYGGALLYGDWFSSSFLIVRDIEALHMLSLQIRTPHCRSSVPYISLAYRGGEDIRTFGLGLAFYR